MSKAKQPKIQVFENEADGKNWYWRLVAPNGKIIAIGGEGYRRRSGVLKALRAVERDLGVAITNMEQENAGAK